MTRIGLTGGIAAGKSTVARMLRELGAFVVDYDMAARDVVSPGSEGLRAIVSAFGTRSLTSEGTLDRAWMARQVFTNDAAGEAARRRLDALLHPLIYDRAAAWERQAVSEGASVIVHDVPLLAEVLPEMPFVFDHIVTVEAPQELRIRRMIETRGMTRQQARARIGHQSDERARRAIADEVIDTTCSMERVTQQVKRLYERWCQA